MLAFGVYFELRVLCIFLTAWFWFIVWGWCLLFGGCALDRIVVDLILFAFELWFGLLVWCCKVLCRVFVFACLRFCDDFMV